MTGPVDAVELQRKVAELDRELETTRGALADAIRIGERVQARLDRHRQALEEIATLKGQAAAIARDVLELP